MRAQDPGGSVSGSRQELSYLNQGARMRHVPFYFVLLELTLLAVVTPDVFAKTGAVKGATAAVADGAAVSKVHVTDTDPPEIMITSPLRSAIILGDTVKVMAVAKDVSAIKHVVFYGRQMNPGPAGPYVEIKSFDGPGPYTFDWDVRWYKAGMLSLKMDATDVLGNDTGKDNNGSACYFQISPDGKPIPWVRGGGGDNYMISLSTNAGNFKLKGEVVIVLKVNDADYRLNYAEVRAGKLDERVEGPTVSWDTTNEIDGPYEIQVTSLCSSKLTGQETSGFTTLAVEIDNKNVNKDLVQLTEPTRGTVVGDKRMRGRLTEQLAVGGEAMFVDAVFTAGDVVIDTVSGQNYEFETMWNSRSGQFPDGPTVVSLTVYEVAKGKRGKMLGFDMVTVDVKNAGKWYAPGVVGNDVTPPKVSISEPENHAKVSGSDVKVMVNATDEVDIQAVLFKVNGKLYDTKYQAPYDFKWDTHYKIPVPDGPVDLEVIAYDLIGNSASASVNVTVENNPQDTTPPKVSFTAPGRYAKVVGTEDVAAEATDDVSIKAVEFKINGKLYIRDENAPYGFTWATLNNEPDGPVDLEATAYDAAGNSAGDLISVTVENNQDNEPPSVRILEPSNGARVSGDKVTITAEVTDNVGLHYVTISAGDHVSKTFPPQGPFTLDWDITKEKDGDHTITVIGLDGHNLDTNKQIHVTIENDPQPPTVEIVSPQEGQPVSGDVTIKVNASDDKGLDNVQIYPNYGGAGTGVSLRNPPFEMTFDSTKFPDGPMPIAAIAVDESGKETTHKINVTVKNTP